MRAGQCLPFNNYEIRGEITAIFLENRQGLKLETIIDTEDLERVMSMNFHWHLRYDPSTGQYYARATGRKSEGHKANYYLHMVIMEFEFDKDKYYVVDHINQDKLDNRKSNLRITEQHKNLRHRKSKNSNNKSGYRNVCWDSRMEQWVVQLQVKGKNTTLGKFDDVDEAGVFAEEMRKTHYKNYAGQN